MVAVTDERFRAPRVPFSSRQDPVNILKQWAALALIAGDGWQNHLPAAVLRRIAVHGDFNRFLNLVEKLDGATIIAALGEAGASVGSNCRIHRGLTIQNATTSLSKLLIGSHVHIGRQVFMDLADTVAIGSRVTISMRTMILTHSHFGDAHEYDGSTRNPIYAPVTVDDDVYIGAGAIILAGVALGKGARVAAGAVVTRSVAAGTTVGGVPAAPLAIGNPSAHGLESGDLT